MIDFVVAKLLYNSRFQSVCQSVRNGIGENVIFSAAIKIDRRLFVKILYKNELQYVIYFARRSVSHGTKYKYFLKIR